MLAKFGAARVGPLPLPLYLAVAAVIYTAAYLGRLPADMIGGFAVIMALGWILGEVGLRTPVLRTIGGPAILALFAPSAMVCYGLINRPGLDAITAVMKTDNFLYLYISCLVCGSILGMNRKILVQGFLRMALPLLIGEIAAAAVATGVGALFGYPAHRTFFYIVIPIIGGGIGEGILPYSLAMAEILVEPQAKFIPQLIPAAMLGNLTAVIFSGCMKRFGEKYPQYSGGGLLVKTGDDRQILTETGQDTAVEFPLMGAGLLVSCALFIFGGMTGQWLGLPGPIIMIFSAAILKYSKVLPESIERGVYHLYRFIAANLTWPLLVGLGVLYVPWREVVDAVTPAYAVVCVSAVSAMWTAGFLVGNWLGMYPVESAMVTGCHTGLGGTGDVAILSAGGRIGLMPFAQAATRIGGALMIVLASLLLKLWR